MWRKRLYVLQQRQQAYLRCCIYVPLKIKYQVWFFPVVSVFFFLFLIIITTVNNIKGSARFLADFDTVLLVSSTQSRQTSNYTFKKEPIVTYAPTCLCRSTPCFLKKDVFSAWVTRCVCVFVFEALCAACPHINPSAPLPSGCVAALKLTARWQSDWPRSGWDWGKERRRGDGRCFSAVPSPQAAAGEWPLTLRLGLTVFWQRDVFRRQTRGVWRMVPAVSPASLSEGEERRRRTPFCLFPPRHRCSRGNRIDVTLLSELSGSCQIRRASHFPSGWLQERRDATASPRGPGFE